MLFEKDIVISSFNPEVKHLEIFKRNNIPFSEKVDMFLKLKTYTKDQYADLLDILEEQSFSEEFTFEIH